MHHDHIVPECPPKHPSKLGNRRTYHENHLQDTSYKAASQMGAGWKYDFPGGSLSLPEPSSSSPAFSLFIVKI